VTIQEASLLAEIDRQRIITSINANLAWSGRNFASIAAWLGGEPQDTTQAPTAAPTTQPPIVTTEPTTSTTLGSASVVASFAVVSLCAIVKHFI
jgi:hypothetical protein